MNTGHTEPQREEIREEEVLGRESGGRKWRNQGQGRGGRPSAIVRTGALGRNQKGKFTEYSGTCLNACT